HWSQSGNELIVQIGQIGMKRTGSTEGAHWPQLWSTLALSDEEVTVIGYALPPSSRISLGRSRPASPNRLAASHEEAAMLVEPVDCPIQGIARPSLLRLSFLISAILKTLASDCLWRKVEQHSWVYRPQR